MNNFEKYEKTYFMPPVVTYDWVKKTEIEKPPVWCSVDLRDGNQALIEPMSLDEKLEFFQMLVDIGFKEIEVGFPAASETEYTFLRTLIDRNLIPILKETLADYDNVTVINEDILRVDIKALAEEYNGGKPIKVVANLPYYITTPIIMGLFESGVPIDNITVMVQKEVADRMKEGPGSKDYGALSLAVQYYAEPEIVANVPPNCFIPRPNVGSAVIRLTRHKEMPVEVKDPALMFKIIRASFNQRRKTLQNGLGNAPELPYTKEQIAAAIAEMGLTPTIRGEALSLAQFAQLSDILGEMK